MRTLTRAICWHCATPIFTVGVFAGPSVAPGQGGIQGSEKVHAMPGLHGLPGGRDHRSRRHNRRRCKHRQAVACRVERTRAAREERRAARGLRIGDAVTLPGCGMINAARIQQSAAASAPLSSSTASPSRARRVVGIGSLSLALPLDQPPAPSRRGLPPSSVFLSSSIMDDRNDGKPCALKASVVRPTAMLFDAHTNHACAGQSTPPRA
jgi:hypothetical protein